MWHQPGGYSQNTYTTTQEHLGRKQRVLAGGEGRGERGRESERARGECGGGVDCQDQTGAEDLAPFLATPTSVRYCALTTAVAPIQLNPMVCDAPLPLLESAHCCCCCLSCCCCSSRARYTYRNPSCIFSPHAQALIRL